jgi:hypothetical protein
MMIVQTDKMSAPSSRERAQRLYDKVFFFPSLKLGFFILVTGLGLSIKLD